MSTYYLYAILPIDEDAFTSGPALHHLSYNDHPLKRFGYFRPGKYLINMSRWPYWLRYFADLNGGFLSKAWRYIKIQMAGIFQTQYPVLQSCVFAGETWQGDEIIPNRVWVSPNQKQWKGKWYGEVKTLNTNDPIPPQAAIREDLGIITRGTMQSGNTFKDHTKPHRLFFSPHEIYVPILGDGRPAYIEMKYIRRMPSSTPMQTHGIVAASLGVRIHPEPSTSSPIIDVLPKNSAIEVLEIKTVGSTDVWVRTERGWMAAHYDGYRLISLY
jgi:hypothetical protein